MSGRTGTYHPRVSSGMRAVSLIQEPAPLLVGERVNATGSRKIKRLLLAEDYDGVLAVAREQLDSGAHILDISVAMTERSDEVAPAGQVLEFSPPGGMAPTGSAIALAVSSGPALRVIPEVAGQSFAAAAAALTEVGLEAVRADDFSETVPAGQVMGTSPASGESVARDSAVTVVVSLGQPTVPNLSGLSVDEATARLQAAGLQKGAVYGPPWGRVFLSTPGSGTKVKPGASVSLFIL